MISELLFAIALTLTMLPLGFFFSCSGCCECVVFYENNAFDSTNLASDFTQVAGAWSTFAQDVRTTDDDAILISNADSAEPRGSISARYSMNRLSTDLEVGESIGLIGAYVDSSNYLKGLVEITTSDEYTVSISEVVAGVETVLESRLVANFGATLGTKVLRLSYSDSEARFCVGAEGGTVICDYTPPSGGLKAGIITGSITVRADFDLYSFTEHVDEAGACASCPACECSFSLESPCSCEVQLEIDGIANGTNCTTCANLNGTWIVSRPQTATCLWSYITIPTVVCAPGGNFVVLSLSFSLVGAEYRRQVFMTGGSTMTLFIDRSSTPISCNMSAQAIATANATVLCDSTAATCEATAL